MSNTDDLSPDRTLKDAPEAANAAGAADAHAHAEPVIDPAEAEAEEGEAVAHAVLAEENKGDARDAPEEDVSLDHVEDAEDALPDPVPVETPADEPAAPPVTPIVTHAGDGKPRRKKREGDSLWELAKTVFYAVLIAVAFRTILFQPFNIPSGSMENNLLIGDYLFISKFSYGYSIYSLPYGYWLHRHVVPGADGRILASDPERGDIVVFKLPVSDDQDYIKRLIGLPGDRIQMKRGILYINDKPVPRTYVRDDFETNARGETRPVKVFRETLPNGVSFETLDAGPDYYFDNTDVFRVPEGHYFMMGDNRDDSDDSRGIVGMVPFDHLEGRARFIWFSIDETAELFKPWTWPGAIRFSRMFRFVE